MKKKVLFIMPSMFIGGAERSLLGLLNSFNYSHYDVSLFLYRHEGEFLSFVPEKVHLLPEIKSYQTFDVPIKSLIFSKKFLFGIARILGKIAKRVHTLLTHETSGIWMSMQYTSRFLLPLLPKIPGKYDLAVMFLGVGNVLVKKVDAQKKITWNHTDYTILYPDVKYDLKILNAIDYIASVSEICTKQFLTVHPSLQSKTITVENILSDRLIHQQSEQAVAEIQREKEEMVLLSIGRYSEAKNFDNVPFICKELIDKGLQIKWYIIGYGGDEALIRKNISETQMEDYVILLGKKLNPYPYIKACDIYVQPSRYEGKCVTVREAQILHKPVIITNYATSSSQLKDGYDGIIVPMDNKGCAEGIASLLLDDNLQQRIIENTAKSDYTNKAEIEKLYQLFD